MYVLPWAAIRPKFREVGSVPSTTFQLSDGEGGFENFQVTDGAGGFEDFDVEEEQQ